MRRWVTLVLCLIACATSAHAQVVYGPSPDGGVLPSALLPASGGVPNPVELLDRAGDLVPREAGDDRPGLSVALNIMMLLTAITLVPSIMLMTTCFVRIIVVLALVRQAMGTQSLPPPQVILGLSLFMTLLVMSPTMERVYDEAIEPYQAGEIREYDVLWDRAQQPLRDFMFDQIEATGNWSGLYMVMQYRGKDLSDPGQLTRSDVDMVELVPAFMLSELKTAFLMGFRVYLPFLVIDMVIASILISMSMMMLPPVLVSLPFKILLFVLVDGWQLIVGSLMTSFAQQGDVGRLSDTVAMLAPIGHGWVT